MTAWICLSKQGLRRSKLYDMSDNPEHQAYFAIRCGEEGETPSFSFGIDFEGIKSWAAGVETKSDESPPLEQVENTTESATQPLAELLSRVADVGLGLSELILALRSVAGLFTNLVSRFEVVEPIQKSSVEIEKTAEYEIYGISADRMIKVREQHRRLLRMESGFDTIPTSVLLTIVATFDSVISEIVRTMLSRHPERFVSGEKSLPVSDVLKMTSFEDFKAKLVDDEVYQFSRGSHDEQVKNIENWFNVKISEEWDKWPDFIEIFERRNLIAHGETSYTARYAKICSLHGLKNANDRVGDAITLEHSYLAQSLDTLIEFGILLIFTIWRKHFPDQEQEAFDEVNEVIYRFISQERYRVPTRVLSFVLGLKGTKASQSTKLMMTVNLASSHKHRDKESKECTSVLDSVDWSAASNRYKICVAALRDDIDEVCKLADSVVATKEISKADFREWPCFDFIRDNEVFQSKFHELFGEFLFEPALETTRFDRNVSQTANEANSD